MALSINQNNYTSGNNFIPGQQTTNQTVSPVNNTIPFSNVSTKGNKKQKNGINQLQQDLIKQLFGAIQPQLGNIFQSDFQANVVPSLFNFDPSKQYEGFQGMTAANAQFDPYQYFGQLPSVQAAQASYDPSQWLNKENIKANAAFSNFNPNNFLSQLTSDYIASIGSDANELSRIRNDMRNVKGLDKLNPEVQAQLDQITKANTGQIDLQYGQAKESLLEDLYGRGLNKSTVALDQGGKLMYGRDQLTQQELGNAANRQIDLQKNIRDFMIQNLLGQASTVRDQFSAKAQQAGLQQQGDLARMDAALRNSLSNAEMATNTNQFNASNTLQKLLAGNQTASQLSQFNAGNQQQANLANSQMAFDRGNLAANLMQQIALQNAGFQQEANQFNAQSDLGIRESINQMLAQIGLANAGFTNEANQFNTNINANMAQNNLSSLVQQLGLRNDLFSNSINSFFNRKQDNKKINLQQLQLELERQQQEKQLAFQYYQLQQQLNAQKGGLFGKIFGGIAGALPGVGGLLGSIKSFTTRKG